MPRGGRRSTTWKPTWKHGKTRTIRVPIVLADSILDLARILDEGKEVPVDSFVTGNVEVQDSLVTDKNGDTVQKLDSKDRSAAIDALNTAISMKQIAISKESKKRSKSNTVTIEKWLKEIESLEKAIAYLKSI
ncbi:MAG: hypothetical protein QNJ38_18995 [Prochloraceae cyanobacterium]|nr:hypothetical protein [Prochloraceae cyanobacterium]